MTKARSQQSIDIEKALRQPGNVNAACIDSVDVCELLLAELQTRRQRLQKLLRLVCLEAESLPVRRASLGRHAHCTHPRIGPTA